MTAAGGHDLAGLRRSAMAAYQRGDYKQALQHIRTYLSVVPGDPEAHFMHGRVLMLTGRFERAEEALEEAVALDRNQARYFVELANVCRHRQRLDDALENADRALAIDQIYGPAIASKAETLRLLGEFERMHALLMEHIDAGSTDPFIVQSFAQVADRFGEGDRAAKLLSRLLRDPRLPPRRRSRMLHLLGNLHDKAGRFNEAFRAFARANEFRNEPFDPDAHARNTSRMIESWSKDDLQALPRSSLDDARPVFTPVFIVGMMRSGTTLIEQIFASHPDVHACGELDTLSIVAREVLGSSGTDVARGIRHADFSREALDRAAEGYVNELARRAHGTPKHITDKMPYNYLLLGLIDRMLPSAKIVHCRRNVLDTCLSCYFHDFHGAQNAYTTNLEWLARYYKDYERIMAHWRDALTIPIFELQYEELIQDPEAVTRSLIEFVDLTWNDACLHFHEADRASITHSSEQVREPIHQRSIGRYRDYEMHIGALREALRT